MKSAPYSNTDLSQHAYSQYCLNITTHTHTQKLSTVYSIVQNNLVKPDLQLLTRKYGQNVGHLILVKMLSCYHTVSCNFTSAVLSLLLPMHVIKQYILKLVSWKHNITCKSSYLICLFCLCTTECCFMHNKWMMTVTITMCWVNALQHQQLSVQQNSVIFAT